MLLTIPTSPADALDRVTILEIKLARGLPVNAELAALHTAWEQAGLPAAATLPEYGALAEVNLALWEIEDRLRAREARGDFGEGFVADARGVYRANDRRAALKRQLNDRLGASFREEKLHPRY